MISQRIIKLILFFRTVSYHDFFHNYSFLSDLPQTEDKTKLFLFNKSNFFNASFLLHLFVLTSHFIFSILK